MLSKFVWGGAGRRNLRTVWLKAYLKLSEFVWGGCPQTNVRYCFLKQIVRIFCLPLSSAREFEVHSNRVDFREVCRKVAIRPRFWATSGKCPLTYLISCTVFLASYRFQIGACKRGLPSTRNDLPFPPPKGAEGALGSLGPPGPFPWVPSGSLGPFGPPWVPWGVGVGGVPGVPLGPRDRHPVEARKGRLES